MRAVRRNNTTDNPQRWQKHLEKGIEVNSRYFYQVFSAEAIPGQQELVR